MTAGAEALKSLAAALESALTRRGFGRADKPFAAHLTLGRVRDPRSSWSEVLRGMPPLAPASARFTVERLSVVESTLSPKGSTYGVRAEAALRRAGRR
jgi:2'-5' RNA ligase